MVGSIIKSVVVDQVTLLVGGMQVDISQFRGPSHLDNTPLTQELTDTYQSELVRMVDGYFSDATVGW